MDTLINRSEVERRTGLSTTTIYRKMRAGTFPLPIKIAERAVRWRESDIEQYVEARPIAAGRSDSI